MKSKPFIVSLAGMTLFVAIIATFWLLSPAASVQRNELSFDEALSRIKNKQIKEVSIGQAQMELVDKSDNKFYVNLDESDAPRNAVVKTTKETGTTLMVEPASRGFFSVLLSNGLPFYFMWALTLAVVVYAVRVLSQNKS